MQKALKWLDSRKTKYKFHDYKELGIDRGTIEIWLQHFPVDKVINRRSTTFKALPEEERASITDPDKAIALMMAHTSIIKRPLWNLGKNKFFLGWDEKAQAGIV